MNIPCIVPTDPGLEPSLVSPKEEYDVEVRVSLTGIFFPGGGRWEGGGPCPEILPPPSSPPPSPPPENPDGKNAQDGNLVFQKCPSGLGV